MQFNVYVYVIYLLAIVAQQSMAQTEYVGTAKFNISIEDDASTSVFLEQMMELLERWRNKTLTQQSVWPKDCAEYRSLGFNTSGIYAVSVEGPGPNWRRQSVDMNVYCDMETDGGGWTVFQRRVSGSVSFERNWNTYKNGFGSLDGNLWWGNDNLALALNDGRSYDLRVDMSDWDDEHRYATYSGFSVAGEHDNYRLHVGTYAGDAGNALHPVDNMQFSTIDRDNDHMAAATAQARIVVVFGLGLVTAPSRMVPTLTPALYRRTQ